MSKVLLIHQNLIKEKYKNVMHFTFFFPEPTMLQYFFHDQHKDVNQLPEMTIERAKL